MIFTTSCTKTAYFLELRFGRPPLRRSAANIQVGLSVCISRSAVRGIGMYVAPKNFRPPAQRSIPTNLASLSLKSSTGLRALHLVHLQKRHREVHQVLQRADVRRRLQSPHGQMRESVQGQRCYGRLLEADGQSRRVLRGIRKQVHSQLFCDVGNRVSCLS